MLTDIKTLKEYILSERLSVVNNNISIHKSFLDKYRKERSEIQKKMKAEQTKTAEIISKMDQIGLTN